MYYCNVEPRTLPLMMTITKLLKTFCQVQHWKWGHKKACCSDVAGTTGGRQPATPLPAGPRPLPAGYTREQIGCVMTKMIMLTQARDWRGMAEHEKEFLRAAVALHPVHPQAAADTYFQLGRCFEEQAENLKAIAYYEKSKIIQGQVGNRANVGLASGNQGLCYSRLGEYAKAVSMYEQERAIAEEIGDRELVGKALENLACMYFSMKHYDPSIRMWKQFMAVAQELGDRMGVGKAYHMLGACLYDIFQYGEAISMHEQAKGIGKELEDLTLLWKACEGLGLCYYSLCAFEKGISVYEEAKAYAKALGDRDAIARTCSGLGSCFSKWGEQQKAIANHEEDKAIREELGDGIGVRTANNNLANCHVVLGEFERALGIYEQVQAGAQEHDDGKTFCYHNLGVCYRVLGQYQRAIEMHEEAKTLAQQKDIHADVARESNALGMVYESIGDYATAVRMYQEAWASEQEASTGDNDRNTHGSASRASILLHLGIAMYHQARLSHRNASASADVHSSEGRAAACADAKRWLKMALDMAVALKLSDFTLSALLYLSLSHFCAGQEEEALVFLKQHLQYQVEVVGRSFCLGCCQKRGDYTTMQTCSGCSVARFCNEDHQRKEPFLKLLHAKYGVKHKQLCPLLRQWRDVKKRRVSEESCTPDLLAFLSNQMDR